MSFKISEIKALLLLQLPLLLFVTSCKKTLNYDNFVNYVISKQNGLALSKQVNGVKVQVTYWPQELLAWQDLKSQKIVIDSIWQSTLKTYKSYHYIKVELSYNGTELLNAALKNKDLYTKLVNKLSFGMGKHAYLINQPKDTLIFIDSHMPRYYGMGKTTELTIIFKAENRISEDLRFELKDLGLGTGDMRFIFKKKKLKSIPQLDYSKKQIINHIQ